MLENGAWLEQLSLPAELRVKAKQSLALTVERWREIDESAFANQLRVLTAFQAEKIGEEDFQESSGYGYHDRGRDRLESLFARVFGGEAALVRTQIVSGTHALTLVLFGLLRPGDLLLCLTGAPYDTLQAVIGNQGREEGTLAEWGIRHHFADNRDGYPDMSKIDAALEPAVVYIQRSAGYDLERFSLSTAGISDLLEQARNRWPGARVIVDNCYGEFVETTEPLAVGADIVAGSLIKNPGGGLAPGGGYITGKKGLVRQIAARLTAPGLYGELGAVTGKRSLFQGLFMAPNLTSNALKNAVFAAALFEKMGFPVKPRWDETRGDIVQAVILGRPERAQRFCQAVQEASPVESHLTLEPGSLPGYADPVIMSAGTFFQGASGELSADAPMREPYAVFIQGGLTLQHALYATCRAALVLL